MTKTTAKPNLFVIGAMKSGTTSLHEYLDTHPQIAMSRQKEPGYFVEELTLHKGEEWYLSQFEQGGHHRYVGESSTHYTKLPAFRGVPERLFRFNPDARLIYVMRNPFERTVSHYWHAVRVRNPRQQHGEPRTLLTAVREEPLYLALSDYAAQLEPYIKRFGKDALYTLTFETLCEDPQRELNGIYRWLDLPEHPLGDQSNRAHNQKPPNQTGATGARMLYRVQFSNAWDAISPRIPGWIKQWAKKHAYRPVDEQKSGEDLARLRAEIGGLQQRQIERLARLLGREFPEWQTERINFPRDRAVAGLDDAP